MSKELIERLREAAAQRVASTAMIGADDLIAAADALESLGAAYSGAVEAGKALAKQALKAERERDALANRVYQLEQNNSGAAEIIAAMQETHAEDQAELKALREQGPVAWVNPSYAEPAQGCTYSREDHERWPHIYSQPLYAHPVPARELTDETIQRHWDEACKDTPQTPGWSRHTRFASAIERYLKGDG